MSSPAGLPLDATITIVNNSGKLISTGKQLLSIWKTAQTSYREKKTELSEGRAQERAAERERAPPPVPVKRAQTFDTPRSIPRRQYDELSVASSARTYRSSIAKKQLPPVPNQLALTEGNLERLSEVSSVAPSKAPSSYGGNNLNLNNAMVVKGSYSRVDPPSALQKVQPRMVARTRSDTEIEAQKRFSMGSDLHLAYGDIPPDLADRVDLDKHTAYSDERTLYDEDQMQLQHIDDEREQAEQLIHKIENLLDEASCAQHSATAIITHLQERPDAAAAVALTLAELSGIITKLSPGFAAILKGSSPAIFALLSSPQFLIGTGIAVGVTVVMFGGWKIVQRIAQNSVGGAKKPMAYEAAPTPLPQIDNGVDEAIVLETVEVDISSIDTWRRGITTDFEAAEMELMTPEADRVVRERRASGVPDDYFGSKSRKSSKTQHRSKTQSSSSHSSSSPKSSSKSKESSDKKSSSGSGSGRRRSLDSNTSGGSLSLFKRSLSGGKKKSDEGSVKGGSVKGSGAKNEELTVKAKMKQNNNMLKALFKSKEHRGIAT